MNKVLLVSTNTAITPYPVYPLGMACVASALEAAGHRVHQFDLLAANESDDKLHDFLYEYDPDYVGISLRNLDNVDSFTSETEWYLDRTKQLIEEIRKQSDVCIILGGPAFSIMPNEIIDYLGGDYGIIGDGERAICQLISFLNEKKKLPRIINGNRQPLKDAQMGPPSWVREMVRFYLDKSGMVNLQTKRGCPFMCVYCSYPTIEGHHFRYRDPRGVADEITRLRQDYGVERIFFTDSVFNDPAGHYLEIAEEIVSRGIDISWYGFFRPCRIESSDIKLLKRSGLQAVETGTDGTDDVTLTALNKGFLFSDVIAFHRACIAENIPIAHFVIFGGPDETVETVKRGIKNIELLKHGVVFAFSGIRIHPHTQLYDRALEEGLLPKTSSLLRPHYYFSNKIKRESMNETIASAFRGHRDRFFPPSEALLRMATMNRFGYRGLLWDRLVRFPSAQ